MKNIRVFSTMGTGIREIEVNANTWGELKQELNNLGISTNDMQGIVKETEASFTGDSAPLPTGLAGAYDFTLYLTPVKTKSGK